MPVGMGLDIFLGGWERRVGRDGLEKNRIKKNGLQIECVAMGMGKSFTCPFIPKYWAATV